MSFNIITSHKVLPHYNIKTNELIQALDGNLSEELKKTLEKLSIIERYSVVDDCIAYLVGKAERKLNSSTTTLAIDATKKCFNDIGEDVKKLGLLIMVTNTADRLLPCPGYEILAELHGNVPHDVNVINMQNAGCSAFLKALDVMNDYINMHPDKLAIIVISEGHTGYIKPEIQPMYYGLHEITHGHFPPKALQNTQQLIESFLFGDGACAFIFGHLGENNFDIKCMAHLTNIEKRDAELLHIDVGGMLHPAYSDFPYYQMSKDVPLKGAMYIKMIMEQVQKRMDKYSNNWDLNSLDKYLIHTGSKKIIDLICKDFNIENSNNPKIDLSYKILNHYGNLSSCSTAFMLNQLFEDHFKGEFLMVSFGVGFSISAGIFRM